MSKFTNIQARKHFFMEIFNQGWRFFNHKGIEWTEEVLRVGKMPSAAEERGRNWGPNPQAPSQGAAAPCIPALVPSNEA
ncbi:hypothetical protein KDI_45210 [Dictyobacter arantiisoli]|uniref:Uncharacterized protein n=1 Tax=Dictyobacter arantiisoli TaxID=2014874 RepID=A0A5A5THV6_9CHLR|nr:hypothetical protein KDI_45210 [Dictyobacter arantiisoli]